MFVPKVIIYNSRSGFCQQSFNNDCFIYRTGSWFDKVRASGNCYMQFMDHIKDVVVTNEDSLYYIIFCACCVRLLIFNFLRFELIVVD